MNGTTAADTLKRIFATVLFDREIRIDPCSISPGGYEMVFGDRTVRFDFQNYYPEISDEDSRILKIEHERPYTNAFPEAGNITKEDVMNLREISEFFIYTGEAGGPELNPVRLLSISFDFGDGAVIDCSETEAVKRYSFGDTARQAEKHI